ncbi:LysR family transcriptional regulator [Undibacterium sp.]|jgi:LysR family transcriptional regulator for bpeEF and oprC|uniref:LysR family transcriptional regulator n=1 Tax=Undibacterium sp. TaxID=1914977 RepID=UPI002CC0CB29|nr:LysR substrate-binding domain-containing protein [Undibacterium sp.]HTD06025.1 LysR substrate-binding domain-containing protein [Undibacterium sp.]
MDQLLAIRAFARVVEVGTFTKAADSLEMPNATLTKLVQALEAHLRVKLLQRTTRRVSVTPEGAAYYEKTMRLLKDLEDVDTSFGAVQSRPRGHLRIDMGSSLASTIIIPALPEFFARYPDIRIDLGVSDRQVDLVGDSVDCVIRGGVLTDMALIGREIGKASWVTCATPAYLKQYGTPAHPDELEKNHVVVSYLSARTNRVAPMNFTRGGKKVEVVGARTVGVNESNAHLAAGLAGLGVIQTFAYTAKPHIDSGALVPILEEWQPSPYPFHVAYPPNRYLSNRLRVFIDWIADRFSALAY